MTKFLRLGGLTFAEILHTHMFMLTWCVTSIYNLECGVSSNTTKYTEV
jgi:hypothetical protein